MKAREASATPHYIFAGVSGELMLYSEYTNRSRPVRVLVASEHVALNITTVYSIAGHNILL